MSHYPPPPDYGQGYGSQEQTQQPPYVPPFPNPYLQPSTGHQQNYAYPMASHMAGNEGAYGYNQNIPSAALAPSVPPLPLFQSWNQDTIPLPPYTAPQAPSYNAGYYNNQAYTAAPQQNQQNQVHQPYAPYVKPAEEGELSEGEFEYGNPASSAQPNTYESAQHWNNDGNGYVDTAHRAVYARNQDGPSRAASDYNYGRASPQTRRQESDSYSPYTSPRETDYSPANRDQQYNSNGQGYRPSPPASKRGNQRSFSGGGNQKHPRVKGTPDPYKSDSHANDFHSSKQSQTTAISERSQAQMTPSEVVAPGITFNGERPKAEAELQRYRKEAQAALLQLSEENVHYPTYIAEGFDQGLVGRYFDDLKLPKTSVKEALQVTTVLHVTNGANGTTVAHKTSDTLGQSSKPDAPPVTQIPTKPTAPTKPAAPTEKELQLKQKMEALRKSREERAQKAAAKNNPVSPVATVDKSEPSSKDSVKDKLSTSPVITEPSIAIEPQITQKTPTPSATISVQQPTREISLPKRPSSPKEAKPQQPIVPIPAPQAGPVIPGLFLASTAATNSPYSSLQSNARKRPVAADFDVPASFTPKRPFGQSRDDRPLVIDVSEEEDEDEDVAMDLDSQYDQDSPVQPVRKLSETKSTTINNLAPLSDVPSRKLFSTPPVPDTTPPAVQTIAKSTLGKPEDLERKMKEIEEMKKRIADAERRKKAKQSSSGSNTPRRIDNSGNDSNLTNKVAASIQIDRLVTMAENKATADQQKLAEAQAAEVEKAAELKRDEAEQKRLRRERLSQELPRVDAGVQEKQAQMEELQAKMAQIQAEIQKDLEEKRRMIEEQEKLGQEAEGQLQAQKDKLQDLNGQESGSSTAPSRPASVHVPEAEDSSKSSSPVAQDQPTQPESLESQIPVVESAPIAPEQEPAKSPPVVVGPASPRDEIEVPQSATQTMEVEQQVATPDEMDAALQEAMRAEVESLEMAGIDVLGVEMEDSYAPDPNQLAPASVSSCVDKTAQSPVASPMLQRKAMEIPDGESDDYEPPEATSSFGAVDDQKDHNEPDEHDVYEPPEALPMDVDLSPKVDPDSPARESSHIDSPPFSPAPPEPVLDVAAQTPNVGLLSTGVNEQDDIESTVPSQSLTLQQPVLENDTEETSNKAIQSFTPYESPLKLFRAYRFHPAFKDEIPGGYRSMTYNHKFDPLKELCRYELAGGICNDVDCDLQHFKNVGLSDNDVLTSLTSHNTFTGEQRTRFVTGLKEVFTGLREKNLDKDFDSIASALVAHRAKFLGDNSKVLPLEGTTI